LAWKARDTALNLLSFRARSASELRLRLRRKEFPAEVVDSCVTSLIEKGLVDDSSFAESFVRDRVRLRPRGPTRLMQELREKGVDGETAEAAVAEIMDGEGVSEVDLARAAAASWRRRSGEDRRKAGNRLYGFLGRRGFSGDAIRIVMEEVMNES
ncbi:MAG TPA: regulatory protein RecX, partial [Longimicrobiaceae bacterium]|nr:regulatory protein RecX [Longimicrobiaceae bacterium]